eukprot:550041_1
MSLSIQYIGQMNKLVAKWSKQTSASSVMKHCVSKGKYQQALDIYDKIHITDKNDICNALALQACIRCNNLKKGKQIHQKMSSYYPQNGHIQSILINLYSINSDDMNTALNIFNSIHTNKTDIVIITSMMKAYINNGFYKEALQLYDEYYSNSTLYTINNNKKDKPIAHLLALKACTNLKDYDKGKQIHLALNKMNIKYNDHIIT